MSKKIIKTIAVVISLLSISLFFTEHAFCKNHRHHRLHKHVVAAKHRAHRGSKGVKHVQKAPAKDMTVGNKQVSTTNTTMAVIKPPVAGITGVNQPSKVAPTTGSTLATTAPKEPTLTAVTPTQADTIANNGVNPRVWQLAVKAYNTALQKGYIKQKILTIIDYSLPSSSKRLWVIDLAHHKILMNTLVAHGKYTGGLYAKHFSDEPGSRASSLGLFLTENTYSGSHGYSLRLRGLEPGFNDKAKSRAIVIHPAWYATQDFAKSHGRLGLSWGCPAVSPQIATPLINQIKNGTAVFAYYPDKKWLSTSRFLSQT